MTRTMKIQSNEPSSYHCTNCEKVYRNITWATRHSVKCHSDLIEQTAQDRVRIAERLGYTVEVI